METKIKSCWRDSLLIGVAKIDEQHKQLVQAIDELMDACLHRKGREVIEKTLNFALKYTKEHFKDEEKLQVKYEYPDLVEHMKLHAQFVEKVHEMQVDFDENGPNVALTTIMNRTLSEWIVDHINLEDRKIGEYIREEDKRRAEEKDKMMNIMK